MKEKNCKTQIHNSHWVSQSVSKLCMELLGYQTKHIILSVLLYLESFAPHVDIFVKSWIFIRAPIHSLHQDWFHLTTISHKYVWILIFELEQVDMVGESCAGIVL